MSGPAIPEPRLVTAESVDPEHLRLFLEGSFGPAKAEFLHRHGSWWHRGAANRWVILVGEEIAGYSAVTPLCCQVGPREVPALWWMDLVVAPAFRGRGLQNLFDAEVRRRAPLLLGFPNELAARIHRKHGWGVREDLSTLLLPFDPRRLNAISGASGWKGRGLRLAAAAAAPLAGLWRRRLARYRPRTARRLAQPTAETLAAIAACNTATDRITTRRDAEFFRWRYLEMPFRDQLEFYVAGAEEAPVVGLISRRLPGPRGVGVRILDLFGNLECWEELEDLVRTASAAAAVAGAHQMTVLAAQPSLARRLRRWGFVLKTTSRFCWSSEAVEIMSAVDEAPHHWSLGDSDNDDTR